MSLQKLSLDSKLSDDGKVLLKQLHKSDWFFGILYNLKFFGNWIIGSWLKRPTQITLIKKCSISQKFEYSSHATRNNFKHNSYTTIMLKLDWYW